MKTFLPVLCAVLLLCACAFGQSTTAPANPQSVFTSSTFSLNASPIALPGGKGTAAGVLAGGTLNITSNFALRQSSFISTGGWTGYFGGVQYAIPSLAKALNNLSSNINGLVFQPYVTASMGVGQIAGASHYSFMAGGGLNYDPAGNTKFVVNLFEVQYAKLPGLANNTVIVSAGPQLRF
jgi:hypothetical protein